MSGEDKPSDEAMAAARDLSRYLHMTWGLLPPFDEKTLRLTAERFDDFKRAALSAPVAPGCEAKGAKVWCACGDSIERESAGVRPACGVCVDRLDGEIVALKQEVDGLRDGHFWAGDVAAIVRAAARCSRVHHDHEDKSALLHALVVEIPTLLESALEWLASRRAAGSLIRGSR